MNVKLVGERQDQSACIAVDSWDTWQAFASSSCPHLVTESHCSNWGSLLHYVLPMLDHCDCPLLVNKVSQGRFLLAPSFGRSPIGKPEIEES